MVDVEALKVEQRNLEQQVDQRQQEINAAAERKAAVEKRLRWVRECIRYGEALASGKEPEEDIPF